jgi:WD40 repeat protein
VVAVSVKERTGPSPAREDFLADAEALFREARRRTRRRRLTRLVLALVIVGGGVLAYRVGFGTQATTALTSAPVPAVNKDAFAHRGILAFVSQGRLWVLDGTKLTAVSRPYGQASSPAFSPNGRWLTYTLENGVQTWLARSDGSEPRLVAEAGATSGWLADGQLVAGTGIWHVSPAGSLTRVGTRPVGLLAWSPDGGRYVFASSTMTGPFTDYRKGVERLQVSSTLTGRRTTWYQAPVSFTKLSGLEGPFIDSAVVLPDADGILFRVDPDQMDDADGANLYEIASRGARPKTLGVTVGLPVTIGPNGAFAITSGGNRYAWQTKTVSACSARTAACSPMPTAHGVLSFDPAYSPDGEALAFIEAPSSAAANVGQTAVQRWYATHTLWIRDGNAAPSEISATSGASTPTWSANGKSLLYVAEDALWLLPTLKSKPIRVASPLFTPGDWSSFYGEVDWNDQFAWLSHA